MGFMKQWKEATDGWWLQYEHAEPFLTLSRDEMGHPLRRIDCEPNEVGFRLLGLYSTLVELPIAWAQWKYCQTFGHDIEGISNDGENGHEVLGCRRCGQTFDCWH